MVNKISNTESSPKNPQVICLQKQLGNHMGTQNETALYIKRLPVQVVVKQNLCSRSQLYKLKAMGKIDFHYLLTTPFIDMDQFYAAMTDRPEGDIETDKMLSVVK